jgi:hypothetical protein
VAGVTHEHQPPLGKEARDRFRVCDRRGEVKAAGEYQCWDIRQRAKRRPSGTTTRRPALAEGEQIVAKRNTGTEWSEAVGW